MRLSVVVPTHDTRELTLACVASVLRAGAAPRDVVVVDDASRDGTSKALAARHPGLVLVRHHEARGFTRSVNRGVEAATGELVLLLNSDAEIAADGLHRLERAFADRPRLGIAGAVLIYPDGTPQWNGGSAPSLPWMFALGSGLARLLGRLRPYRNVRPATRLGTVAWVSGAALAVRRQVWDELGGFDPRFRFYGQDLDLCLRAGRAGWEVAVLPELRVLHHHGATIGRSAGGQLQDSPELLWTDLLRWWEKERGPGARRRAAATLLAGAALRLAGRRLAAAVLRGERRAQWRRTTERYLAAVAAVRSTGPATL